MRHGTDIGPCLVHRQVDREVGRRLRTTVSGDDDAGRIQVDQVVDGQLVLAVARWRDEDRAIVEPARQVALGCGDQAAPPQPGTRANDGFGGGRSIHRPHRRRRADPPEGPRLRCGGDHERQWIGCELDADLARVAGGFDGGRQVELQRLVAERAFDGGHGFGSFWGGSDAAKTGTTV